MAIISYLIPFTFILYSTLGQDKSFAKNFFQGSDLMTTNSVSSENWYRAFMKLFDANDDGKIERNEYVRAWMVRTGGSRHFAESLFVRGDKNNDNEIDGAEIRTVYDRFDTNGDSNLTKTEYMAQWSYIMSRLPYLCLFDLGNVNFNENLTWKEMRDVFKSFDVNDDGEVIVTEVQATCGLTCCSNNATVNRMFNKVDADGDRKIQLTTEVRSFFNSSDTDGDSFVTDKEFVEKFAEA